MKQLFDVLYITQQDARLSLYGDCIKVSLDSGVEHLIPLHTLERIVSFSFMPISPQLMEACAERRIGIAVLSQTGRLKFQVTGETHGNVLLRLNQCQAALSKERSLLLAREMIRAKISGHQKVLERFCRNHSDAETDAIFGAIGQLQALKAEVSGAESAQRLFGIEGAAAKAYFSVFDRMILRKNDIYRFCQRSRRPPQDPCNTLLSFAYTLLAQECKAALECAGLDPYIGFFHRERPGKPALALDLMEGLRPFLADRFVMRLINLKMIDDSGFEPGKDGGIYLNASGRTLFLKEWNRMRHREISLENTDGPVPLGLIPHLQAQQLAAVVRDHLETYQPVPWR